MICSRPGHSRPIICQFRTVHFLVNILVSGKISVSSLFVSLLELVVKLGQRTGITDEQRLPPLPSPRLCLFLSRGIICWGWMWKRRRRRRVRAAAADDISAEF